MQLFWSMARDPDIFQSSVASSRDASLFPIFLQCSSLCCSSVLFRKHLVYNCIAAPLENRSTFLVSVRNRKWFTWETIYANSVAFLVTSASVLQKVLSPMPALNLVLSQGSSSPPKISISGTALQSVDIPPVWGKHKFAETGEWYQHRKRHDDIWSTSLTCVVHWQPLSALKLKCTFPVCFACSTMDVKLNWIACQHQGCCPNFFHFRYYAAFCDCSGGLCVK